MERAKVGVVGCGNIFGAYVKGCRAFDILDVVACADGRRILDAGAPMAFWSAVHWPYMA